MTYAPKILGLSATLRNARAGRGAQQMIEEIAELGSREAFDRYVGEQAAIHLEQFVDAGRAEGKPFDELYKNLRKMGGTRGLSNSEVCLAAALWGARDKGASVDIVSLADHFPADGSVKALDELKAKVRAADGILLATPVYFGDRSSLSQRFIEAVRADPVLRKDVEGKVYAGLSVGAKRNGGQETTLIYQMQEMANLGFLAVGNDATTTSQYGGTAHAGDIGTIPKDQYGLNTSIGTGRRIAQVAATLMASKDFKLRNVPRVGVWQLQDREDTALDMLRPLFGPHEAEVTTDWVRLIADGIRPCIACDICPTHVGPDEEYRCIIKKREDNMTDIHRTLLQAEILMPVTYSPLDRGGLTSVYQQFMERTRYLRRGDYVFSDRLVAPVVFAEVGATESLDIRMMTSFIRHHTVIHRPLIGWLHKGELLNAPDLCAGMISAIRWGRRLVAGHLALVHEEPDQIAYNPVGYVLSQAKDNEADTIEARKKLAETRQEIQTEESRVRLAQLTPMEGPAKAG